VPNERDMPCGASAWLIAGLSRLFVRICDTPMRLQRCGNHRGDAVRARAPAGLDIAKPIAGIVDLVGEWIADVTFSTKTLFARSRLRATCSF
jgi:hypothetical protein